MQNIIIFANSRSVSVEIENGATRTTRGATFADAAAAMHPEDRKTLAQFCAGVLATLKALPEGGR